MIRRQWDWRLWQTIYVCRRAQSNVPETIAHNLRTTGRPGFRIRGCYLVVGVDASDGGVVLCGARKSHALSGSSHARGTRRTIPLLSRYRNRGVCENSRRRWDVMGENVQVGTSSSSSVMLASSKVSAQSVQRCSNVHFSQCAFQHYVAHVLLPRCVKVDSEGCCSMTKG